MEKFTPEMLGYTLIGFAIYCVISVVWTSQAEIGVFFSRFVTSSNRAGAGPDYDEEDHLFEDDFVGQGNGKNAGNGIAMHGNEGNDPFSFPDAFTAVALLIEHKGISETDALRIVFGAKAGKKVNAAGQLTRYGAAHAQLQTALASIRKPAGPQFPQLTPEQLAGREKLELPVRG